jgi:putative toxin-antitoxin system antitoxin component (TIGR02293 family)
MRAAIKESDAPAYVHQVADMLGVLNLFRHNVHSTVAVHEILNDGLPRRALLKVLESARIPTSELLPVFAISARTLMRLKAEPNKRLGVEQSGRVWRFTEMLAKAEDVLGSSERALEWMLKPAMALENRRPIELLTTPVGSQLVDDVIERMRYGVYQ